MKGQAYQLSRFLADTWCAAFVWKKDESELGKLCPTERTFRKIETYAAIDFLSNIRAEVERLQDEYQFFHWHLAFPDVFRSPVKDETPENEHTGWNAGFDVVLGNPPWERVKLQEKEWFAERCPEITKAPNAATRKRQIDLLKESSPILHEHFLNDSRKSEGESHLMRNSGRYPLCGRGDINLYTVFAEGMRSLLSSSGRMGAVLPSGLATDDTTKHFFGDLMKQRSLVSFIEFENNGFFPSAGQGHMLRFALTTIAGPQVDAQETDFAFQLKAISELRKSDCHFTLSKDDMGLLSPNTGSCPIFRMRRDAELNKHIYRRVPILVREVAPQMNPWGMQLSSMFHMANDSSIFRTAKQLTDDGWSIIDSAYCKKSAIYVPLVEAKLVYQYNHRHGDFSDAEIGKRAHVLPHVSVARLENAEYVTLPFYWVPKIDVEKCLGGVWKQDWLIGWRRVTDSRASARTFVGCLFPRYGVGDNIFLSLPTAVEASDTACLLGALNSFVFDYTARQKLGGINLLFFVFRQLPVLQPEVLVKRAVWSSSDQTLRDWILPRILELTYTSWDLEAFARDCDYAGPPFRWDEERRFLLRAELDAAFFHLYLAADQQGEWVPSRQADGCPYDESPEDLGRLKASFPTPRTAVSYIMDTFPIVRRKDEEKFGGEYRTKHVILEIYDAMQVAIHTGRQYQSQLDPPPADHRVSHPPREFHQTIQ